ncbi:unnamed protein product [Polarella glacialis]|uniref:Palmitoyltransferase n=1 Tax=Polarella glacialis TaxID=89957 RepID=A0A813GMJ3_POLGL|nr:unnamed protein product [Polarella glacialis]
MDEPSVFSGGLAYKDDSEFLASPPEPGEQMVTGGESGALVSACRHENFEAALALLDRGVSDVNEKDQTGYTALHWAARNGSPGLVSELLARGAALHEANREGLQAVHLAVRNGRLSTLAALWRHDAAVISIRDAEGGTAAHHAAHCGCLHLLEWLYMRGVAISLPDVFGLTPLHCAVMAGRPLVAQLLIRAAADPLAVDAKGRIPLHWVALKGSGTLLSAALQIHPDAFGGLVACSAKDQGGKVPRERARWHDCPMRLQLWHVQAWLRFAERPERRSSRSVGLLAPRQPCMALTALLTPLLHCINAFALLGVLVPKLLDAGRLAPELAMLAMGQGLGQLLSLRLFLLASSSDPGYCAVAARLNSSRESGGPDGHERLCLATAKEWDALMNRQLRLENEGRQQQQKTEKNGCSPSTCSNSTVAAELTDVREQMKAVKVRMKEDLKQASFARLQHCPEEYAVLACSEAVEASPVSWGTTACVICCRLRSQRCKHCKDCGRCVARFDHHCPWLGNCVGALNLHVFIRFLAWTTLALLASLGLIWQSLDALPWFGSGHVLDGPPLWRILLELIFALNCVLSLFSGCLLMRQVCLLAVDLTEYEASQGNVSVFQRLRKFSSKELLDNLALRVLGLGDENQSFHLNMRSAEAAGRALEEL